MLTVQTSTWSPSLEASSLNRRVSLSQTGVSSDGTALKIKTLPLASLSLTVCRALSTTEKSGAACPGLISGPDRVTGPPLKVTTPVLSSGICFLLQNLGSQDLSTGSRIRKLECTVCEQASLVSGWEVNMLPAAGAGGTGRGGRQAG